MSRGRRSFLPWSWLGLIALICLVVPATAWTGSDSAYDAADTPEPNGPSYLWYPITSNGTSIAPGDTGEVQVSMPFSNFSFYGTNRGSVYVTGNGAMMFIEPVANHDGGDPFPDTFDPDAVIGMFWEDLDPSSGGSVRHKVFGTAPYRTFVVQYLNVPHFGSTSGTATFQAHLHESFNAIDVHYNSASSGGTPYAGIENNDGTIGINYAIGTSASSKTVQYRPDGVIPVLSTDSFSVLEDASLVANVLANDRAVGAAGLEASLVASPTQHVGAFALATDGSFTYTPTADFCGTDSFTYEVTDTFGTYGPVTVDITVTCVNDEPSFTPGADLSVSLAQSVTVGGWASAISMGPSDESSQTGAFTVVAQDPSLFSVQPAVSATGDLTFTPAYGKDDTALVDVTLQDDGGTANGGDDSYPTQVLRVVIDTINDAPSFTTSGDVTVLEDAGPVTLGWVTSATAGPSDESGQNLSYVVTSNDEPGLFATLPAVDSAGTLTFEPKADAFGTANLQIQIRDDGGTANGGDDTGNIVTFAIEVSPVNDAPELQPGTDVTVLEDAGAKAIAWATGITIGPSNEASQWGPTTILRTANTDAALFATQPVLTKSGVLTFETAQDRYGSADVTFEVNDHGGTANGGVESASYTVTILVTPVNDPPVAIDHARTIQEDTSLVQSVTLGVRSGASDVDDVVTDLVAGLIQPPQHGSVTLQADGAYTYVPDADYHGADRFTYQLDDGENTSATRAVDITIQPVNDRPVAVDDVYSFYENTTANPLQVMVNDHDLADGETLSLLGLPTVPSGHTLTWNAARDGYIYTPPASWSGTISFTYTVRDTSGASDGSDVATVTITVLDPSTPDAFLQSDPAQIACVGVPVTFTAQAHLRQATVSAWDLDFGDGQSGSVAPTGSTMATDHTYQAKAILQVVLEVTFDEGSTVQVTKPLEIHNCIAPEVQFTHSLSGQFLSVTDQSQDTDGTIVDRSWEFGDGATATGIAPAAHEYAGSGTFVVRLTVTDEEGNQATMARTITLQAPAPSPGADKLPAGGSAPGGSVPLPQPEATPGGHTNQPPVAVAGAFQRVDPGTSVLLDGTQSSDPDGQTVQYAWVQVEGPPVELLPEGPGKVRFTAVQGMYLFRLTASDGALESHDEVTVSAIEIDEPYVEPPRAFTIEVDGSELRVEAEEGWSYTWDFGDGQTATGHDPTHTYDAPGSYVVKMTITTDDGVHTVSQLVTVEATSEPQESAPVQSVADPAPAKTASAAAMPAGALWGLVGLGTLIVVLGIAMVIALRRR